MNTIKFDDKGSIQMIAHRGVSGLELENTCPAFIAAGVKSYYGIETDVHVTADGKYILFHDDNLQRILGKDDVIEQSNFDDLRKLRLLDTDRKTDRADIFMPSLEEYIYICKKYDKVAVLELKNPMTREHVHAIADIINQIGWLEKTTFISFCGENLVLLREKYPNANAQFLFCEMTDTEFNFMVQHRLDADICHVGITKEVVDKLHAEGLKVNCWTVDTLEVAQRVKAAGVDQITSNILE